MAKTESGQKSAEGKITGGCACGAVRYAFSGKMMWPGICHCRICQKMSGAAGGAWFGVLRDSGEITGKTVFYQYSADSGNRILRGACEKCRAPVYNQNSMMSDVFIIAAGSLDKPELFVPRMRFYTDSAPDWVEATSTGTISLPEFPGMPHSEKEAQNGEFRAEKTARDEELCAAAGSKTAPKKGK